MFAFSSHTKFISKGNVIPPIPPGVKNTNYTVLQNSGTMSITTQAGNTLRFQAGERGPAYGYNSWSKYNPGVAAGNKTITVIFKFNCSGASNIGDNAFGIFLCDGGTKGTSFSAWTNIWRSITWNLNSPNNAPTSYNQNSPISYSGQGWLDSAATFYNGTNYGLRVVDTGTNLTYYRSIDGGSTWNQHTSPTYAQAGLSSSPTQFGFFAKPTNTASDTLFDATVVSLTIA